MLGIEIDDTATGIKTAGTFGFIVFIDDGLVSAIKTPTGYVLEYVNYLQGTQGVTYHFSEESIFMELKKVFNLARVPYYLYMDQLNFVSMSVMTLKKAAPTQLVLSGGRGTLENVYSSWDLEKDLGYTDMKTQSHCDNSSTRSLGKVHA